MHKLIDYLIELGYKPKKNNPKNFSTSSANGCQMIFYKKSSKFIFGFHHAGQPPTLIYPKLNIEFDVFTKPHFCKIGVNRVLESFDPKEIMRRYKRRMPFEI